MKIANVAEISFHPKHDISVLLKVNAVYYRYSVFFRLICYVLEEYSEPRQAFKMKRYEKNSNG